MGGERPDAQSAVGVPVHPVQFAQSAYVDEVARPGQPVVHHRDEALPAGDDLRVVAELGQQPRGSVDVTGPVVLEGAGFMVLLSYVP